MQIDNCHIDCKKSFEWYPLPPFTHPIHSPNKHEPSITMSQGLLEAQGRKQMNESALLIKPYVPASKFPSKVSRGDPRTPAPVAISAQSLPLPPASSSLPAGLLHPHPRAPTALVWGFGQLCPPPLCCSGAPPSRLPEFLLERSPRQFCLTPGAAELFLFSKRWF